VKGTPDIGSKSENMFWLALKRTFFRAEEKISTLVASTSLPTKFTTMTVATAWRLPTYPPSTVQTTSTVTTTATATATANATAIAS
jgi:hypothetical protein